MTGSALEKQHNKVGIRAKMKEEFFQQPVLNSPYDYPARHWELDESGQPTQRIIETRRHVEFITPIPKLKKRTQGNEQAEIVFDESKGLSSEQQQYDPMSVINEEHYGAER